MKITMQKLAAGPEFVLQPGKTYNLPAETANALLTTVPAAAVPARDGAKVTRIPATPDPEDTLDDDDTDEAEDE